MNRPTRGNSQSTPDLLLREAGLTINRHASRQGLGSVALTRVCDELALISEEHPGIDIRHPKHYVPRVVVIRKKDFLDRADVWGQARQSDARQALIAVNRLTRPRDVQVVDCTTDYEASRGESYLHVLFSDRDEVVLREDHFQAWTALAEMATVEVADLALKAYSPDMRLAFIPPHTLRREQAITRMEETILAAVPFRVGLRPVLSPKN